MNRRFFIFYDHIFSHHNNGFQAEIGGVQRYLHELSLIIKSLGFEVYVIQFGDKRIQSKFEGINVLQLKIKGTKKFKKAFDYVLDELNFNSENDVVIWGADTISVKLDDEIKSISIQHGIACDMVELNTPLRKAIRTLRLIPVYKKLQRDNALRAFNNSNYRVCVDYNFVNWYRTFQNVNGDELKNIHIIPNFSHIPPALDKNKIPEEKLERLRISFARRFVHKRGVSLMVEVARMLLSKYDNLEIIFAGSGPMLGNIKDLQSEFEDKVIITSFNPADTFKFHSTVDIAVVPTIGSEGTSLSLLEAMASNTAVVCTNIGGMSNIVIDEFNGLICNPNTTELYKSISKLIESTEFRNKISSAARTTVEEGFSYDIWRDKWVDLILTIVEK